MTELKSSIKEVLDKHKAFWNMEDVNQPLIMTLPSLDEETSIRIVLTDGSEATDGLHLEPQMISPERFPLNILTTWGALANARYDNKCRREEKDPSLIGDLFNPISPCPKIPWMEAICGCPIRISIKANTIWAEPVQNSDSLCNGRNEKWMEKLKAFTAYLTDKFSGQYLLSATLMRGPLDVLSAMLGKKELILSGYRRKAETQKVLNVLAETFIATAKTQLDIIPSFHGGYCSLSGLWAPGTIIRTQDDESLLFSPEICKELVLPNQERIANEFDYSVMDIHSGAELHEMSMFLDSESIKAISIVLDPPPFGKEIDVLLPSLSKVQGIKPLQISGKLTRKQINKITETLSPRGLAIAATLTSD